MKRREFLRQVVLGAAVAAMVPLPLLRPQGGPAKLDEICWALGRFVRQRNIHLGLPCRIIGTDERGRLVIQADRQLCSESAFHIAERDMNRVRLGYRVNHKHLERATGINVLIRAKADFYSFWVPFQ
jgi:hypothetical protein